MCPTLIVGPYKYVKKPRGLPQTDCLLSRLHFGKDVTLKVVFYRYLTLTDVQLLKHTVWGETSNSCNVCQLNVCCLGHPPKQSCLVVSRAAHEVAQERFADTTTYILILCVNRFMQFTPVVCWKWYVNVTRSKVPWLNCLLLQNSCRSLFYSSSHVSLYHLNFNPSDPRPLIPDQKTHGHLS